MKFMITIGAIKQCFDEQVPCFVCLSCSTSRHKSTHMHDHVGNRVHFLFFNYSFGHFTLLLDIDSREMTVSRYSTGQPLVAMSSQTNATVHQQKVEEVWK